MSGIRVTYSGLISFAIGISSILTGTIFTLIVTRTLTAEEFGTWNLIGGLITYVIIAEPIISYWVTREVAREIDSGRTAIISSGLFSGGGLAIYVLIAYFVAQHVQTNSSVLLFAAILIPVMFLNRTLTAINLGTKPHTTSYGILSFELSKIPVGLILVYFLHMGIVGAISATAMAYLVSIIILVIYARDKIRGKFKKEFFKKWIKLGWLSIYPGISNVIYHLDVIIFSVISGSVVGLAFYSASQTVSNLVANSSLVSQAVYPKLLEGGKREHVQENLMQFFYFAFPLTALCIVFAKPALFALKPIYDIAVPVVVFMTIRAFLYSLGGIYSQFILGIEKVDINENSAISDYIKSKLFHIPTIVLIQYTTYAVSVLVGLLLLKPYTNSTIDLVTYWSIISLGTQVPFTIYFYLLVRKYFKPKMNWKSLLKYLLTSMGIFVAVYLLMDRFLIYKRNIMEFLPNVLLFVGIGIGSYILLTYLLDSRTKKLFNAIISETRGKKS